MDRRRHAAAVTTRKTPPPPSAGEGRRRTALPVLPAAMLVVALSLASCSSSRDAARPVPAGRDAWPMFGGGPSRAGVAPGALVPPLTREWAYDAGAGFGPASAAVADGAVWVGTLAGELRVVDIVTGIEILGEDPGDAVPGTPILSNGKAYVAVSGGAGGLVRYDARTAEREWSADAGGIASSPLLVDGRIIVATDAAVVAAFDTAAGQLLWSASFPRDRGNSGVHSSPAAEGGMVYACTGAGVLGAFRLDDGALLWTAPAGGPVLGGVIAAGGRVFVGSLAGSVRAFTGSTGEVAWSFDAGSPVFGSPAVSSGTLVVGTSGGDLIALRSADGSLLWRSRCSGGAGAAPLIAGGFVYAGDLGGGISAFDLRTGAVAWSENVGMRIRTAPVAADGRLIVLAEDRTVICFTEAPVGAAPAEGPAGEGAGATSPADRGAAPTKGGVLAVSTDPPGAMVFLDSVLIGRSPLEVPMPAPPLHRRWRDRVVSVVGGEPGTWFVPVVTDTLREDSVGGRRPPGEGDTLSLSYELPTTARIDSDPSGAEVTLGDSVLGRTPLFASLPRGVPTVVLRKEGYRDAMLLLDPATRSHHAVLDLEVPLSAASPLASGGGGGDVRLAIVAGAAIASGTAAAVLKGRADALFDEYKATGSGATLDRVRGYDLASALALVVAEIGFGYVIIELLSR